MDYDLQPGDMQFINNHTILHARGAFEDWEDEKDGGKRHLLRTWISPPNGRSVKRLPPYSDVKASCLNCLEILALRMLSLIGDRSWNLFFRLLQLLLRFIIAFMNMHCQLHTASEVHVRL